MQLLNHEQDTLIFENTWIRRTLTFRKGQPIASAVTRKESGYTWASNKEMPILFLPDFDWNHVETTFDDNIITFHSNYTVRWIFSVSENQPAIRSQLFVRAESKEAEPLSILDLDTLTETDMPAALPAPDITERVFHTGKHIKLKKVRFYDQTDRTDSLVRSEEIHLYHTAEAFDGNLFFFTDPTVNETCMIQKEAPCGTSHVNRYASDLSADYGCFSVTGSGIDYDALSDSGFTAGYPITIGVCAAGEAAEMHLCRSVYASDCGGTDHASGFAPFIMSNTWGDRSQDKCISESFLKMEILRAVQIGVDVVQIDDGWQTGRSSNSALTKNGVWNGGFYANNPDFWVPDPNKFPSGFDALCQFAYEHHVALGLWFSPDAEDHYANWKLDAQTILDFYRRFGICHFKLDGMCIRDKIAEKNFLRMCFCVLMESEGHIAFQMDITNESRLGYFYQKELGTLFVENRYTDHGSYYPHNTLRNLWQLAQYLPAQKLLFEVLNNKRNAQRYLLEDGSKDMLAPDGYDMDYLFATVMAANPLLWCEMQHLDDSDIRALHDIVFVYRKYRDDFLEIIPAGMCPNGFSLTGFSIRGREHDYYIGIRELSDKSVVMLPHAQILHTNDTDLQVDDNRVIFSDQRKYFFAMLERSADMSYQQ